MFIGIDVGSRTSKAVAVHGADIMAETIRDTGPNPGIAGELVLEAVLDRAGARRSDVRRIVGTGYGRVSMSYADTTLTELSCHAAGAHFLNPAIRTVIDIGGQDSKVIRLDEDGNMLDFMMNDKCAAGTGRFMEVAAKALGTDLDHLGLVAEKGRAPCEINSMCAVFAESEIISLLASGQSPENVAAGLHKAFARRLGAMAKRVGTTSQVAFTGGVAKNIGLAQAISAHLNVELTSLPVDPQIVGALGAAVIAERTMQPAESTATYSG